MAEFLDSLRQGPREAAPDLLILADGDHGFGNAMNVQRTVRAYGRAGAAAILVEDKITPRALTAAGKPSLPRDEARMKIRAAVEAAKDSGILVMARTDCRPTLGIDEAVARIECFVEEGGGHPVPRFPGRRGRDPPRRRRRRGTTVLRRPVAGRAAGDAHSGAGRGAGVQDRDLSDRHAVAGGGRQSRPGWPALNAGQAEAASAIESDVVRDTLGYGDYENEARRFTSPD